MIGGLLGGLFIAWFLTLFGLDVHILRVFQSVSDIPLTTEHYYLVFGVIGMIHGLFNND